MSRNDLTGVGGPTPQECNPSFATQVVSRQPPALNVLENVMLSAFLSPIARASNWWKPSLDELTGLRLLTI
jgi:hypothetical protein